MGLKLIKPSNGQPCNKETELKEKGTEFSNLYPWREESVIAGTLTTLPWEGCPPSVIRYIMEALP